ncbi:MAG: SDR family oxidoreductase [Caulobacterales bacterium]
MKTGTSERPDLPIAVVIGGGGMGMSTARRLGQSHRIVLASLSADKNVAREAALKEDGIDAVAVQCDITDPQSVGELAQFVASKGRFRTLAHVAALAPAAFDWENILEVDLIGARLMERAMFELAGEGAVAVFVSSIAAHIQVPPEVVAVLDDPLASDFLEKLADVLGEAPHYNSAYGLAKFAVNRMCRLRASAWGAKRARIVSVSPGLIATPMGAKAFETQPALIGLLHSTPLQREGTMVETADAIEFLASSRASYITGCDLLVDGGFVGAREALPS